MKPLESIRQDIEDLRELILSLDDEIWSRIDHRDEKTFSEYSQRKLRINDRIKDFQKAGNALLDCLAELPVVQLPVAVSAPQKEEETVAPLDRHFAFTKPNAFLFDGVRIGPTKTWRSLWQKFLELLHREHPAVFLEHIVKNSCIAGVATAGDKFQEPFECGGVWIECNLSADAIRDRIRNILLHAKIDTGRMKIVLRGNPDLAGTMFDALQG